MNIARPLILSSLLAPLLLAACASQPPLNTVGVDRALQVRDAVPRLPAAMGRRVLWGGTIVRSENLPQYTELEVLGYPLDDDQEPRLSAGAEARFIIQHPGYLETADYAPGRLVTVVGTLQGVRQGKVDQYDYRFPIVQAGQLKLWSAEKERGIPGFNIGLGVGFGF